MVPTDSAEHTTALPSFVGGLLWGLARVITVVFAPIPAKKRDIFRAFAEAASSAIAGGLGGLYIAPAVCKYLHISDIETVSAIALFFGLAFWQSIPMVVAFTSKFTALHFGMATPDKPKEVGEP